MKGITLSSRLTLLYKLILPIFFGVVTLLMWIMAIALHGKPDAETLIVIAAIFTGFMLFITPPMFINKVSYDDDKLYAYNYRTTKEIPLGQVGKVHRWMFYFYKIDYLNEAGQKKAILLLPSFIQRFEAMMGMPENLKAFEEEVTKRKPEQPQ